MNKRIALSITLTLTLGFASNINASLVDIEQRGNIVYFGFSAPNKVMRYDLAEQSFLEDIRLDQVPTAMHVSDDYVYVAFHREVRRLSLDVNR